MKPDKKKAKKRKDNYGNVLYTGEYYNEKKDNYEYKFKDAKGDPKTKCAKTLDQLRTLEDAIKTDISSKLIYGSKEITVNELVEIYLNSKKKIEKTTLTGYWYNFERYIKPSWLGNMKIGDVIKIHVSNYYNELIEEMRLSKPTIVLINNFVSPAFRLAMDSRWLTYNPCTLVMREVIDTYVAEKIALSKAQQDCFLDHVKNYFPSYYNMIYIAIFFGLRVGEVLGMSKDELNFVTKKFNLDHQIIYKKLHGESQIRFMVHTPKTKNGVRYMYFFDKEAEMCLKKQIEYAEYIYDTIGNQEIDEQKDFIFVSSNGLPLTPNSINRTLDTIIKSFNKREMVLANKEKREAQLLPHISSHNLRHTGLTRMAEAGIAPQTLQFLAGHSSINFTLTYYVHATEERVEDDMKRYAEYYEKASHNLHI